MVRLLIVMGMAHGYGYGQVHGSGFGHVHGTLCGYCHGYGSWLRLWAWFCFMVDVLLLMFMVGAYGVIVVDLGRGCALCL